MSYEVNYELLDRVLGNVSPAEFKGQNTEEIRIAIEALNEEWEREDQGLTEEEISEAINDIEYLNQD